MDLWDLNENEIEDKVHDLLCKKYWPEHLNMGVGYSLQADDQDGNPDTGWFTVTIVSRDTVTIEVRDEVPVLTDGHYKRVFETYQARIHRTVHPLVHRALLYLALAFRVDRAYLQYLPKKEREALIGTKNRNLRKTYQLLDNMPFPPALETNHLYTVTGEEGTIIGVFHTVSNDSSLVVGPSVFRNVAGRIRSYAGGGNYNHTYSALKILAEAIRLETEVTE